MRISDWSSDVCSSDLYEVLEPRAEALERAMGRRRQAAGLAGDAAHHQQALVAVEVAPVPGPGIGLRQSADHRVARKAIGLGGKGVQDGQLLGGVLLGGRPVRSEEHTSELQSLL